MLNLAKILESYCLASIFCSKSSSTTNTNDAIQNDFQTKVSYKCVKTDLFCCIYVNKIFGSKIAWGNKIWVQKFFGSKNVGSQKILGQLKNWAKEISG